MPYRRQVKQLVAAITFPDSSAVWNDTLELEQAFFRMALGTFKAHRAGRGDSRPLMPALQAKGVAAHRLAFRPALKRDDIARAVARRFRRA
jgi:hypothetical protein